MKRILVLFGILCWQAAIVSAIADERWPNVVLILADDLGVGDLGCYGQQKIKTPNIDRVAAEGIRFTEFYAGCAVCAPSRCALLTGKHMGHAYIRDNKGDPKTVRDPARDLFAGELPLPREERLLTEVLKPRGYATGVIGKWGLGAFGTSGDPNKRGVDLFYGFTSQVHAHNHYPRFLWRNDQQQRLEGNEHVATGKTYAQDRFTEEAIAFLREQKYQPFFLYLPFTIPHLGIQVPEASLAEYAGKFPETPVGRQGTYFEHATPHAGYAAMVSHLDRAVGKLMDEIKSLGLDEQTLVLFSSDNGPTFDVGGADSEFFNSAAGCRGLKGSLYEGGIRTPLIARWSGKIKSGTTTDHMSGFWDVLPSLAELTGAEKPANIDGISFAPTLLGHPDKQAQHDYLYWEFPGYGGWQALRRGEWKAVRHDMQKKDNPDPLKIALYDLKNDPAEQHDLAAAHPDIAARLSQLMTEAHSPSREFPMRSDRSD